jgi:hypothetical protein
MHAVIQASTGVPRRFLKARPHMLAPPYLGAGETSEGIGEIAPGNMAYGTGSTAALPQMLWPRYSWEGVMAVAHQ